MAERCVIHIEQNADELRITLTGDSGETRLFTVGRTEHACAFFDNFIGVKLISQSNDVGTLLSKIDYSNDFGCFPSLASRGALHILSDKGVRALAIQLIDGSKDSVVFVDVPDGGWIISSDLLDMLRKLFDFGTIVYCGKLKLCNVQTLSFQITKFVAKLCMVSRH